MEKARRFRWSLTGIGAFGAVVFFMIGLPGFADDLEAWQQAIEQARRTNTDWMVWFTIALGFVLVAIAPWVIPDAYYRVRAWRIGKPRPGVITIDGPPGLGDGGSPARREHVSDKLQEAYSENGNLAAQLEELRAAR